MYTQRPDGTLTIGDTYTYATTPAPFEPEELDAAVLKQAAALLGTSALTVRERRRGVYGTGSAQFVVESPAEGVRAVAVTAGVGMTTAFGLAAEVVEGLVG